MNVLQSYFAVSGGNTAGIAQAFSQDMQINCFSTLKGKWLHSDIEATTAMKLSNLTVIDEYCQGGYANASK